MDAIFVNSLQKMSQKGITICLLISQLKIINPLKVEQH